MHIAQRSGTIEGRNIYNMKIKPQIIFNAKNFPIYGIDKHHSTRWLYNRYVLTNQPRPQAHFLFPQVRKSLGTRLLTNIIVHAGCKQVLMNIIIYSGKLSRRELPQIGGKYDLCRENFCGLLACVVNRYHTSNFCGENFHEQPQNLEICKGFLPQKFHAIQQYTLAD